MSDDNVFDELDDRSEAPGFGSGDFADWWEPDEDDGERLVGPIVEKHSAPEEWTEAGEVPDQIYTVLALGRGDCNEGQLYTPKQHKQLQRGLGGAAVGDVVNLKFTGYEKVQGNMMHTYEVSYIREDEWEAMGGSDEIRNAIDDHKDDGGIWGDNTRTEPYQQTSEGAISSNVDEGGGAIAEAAEYLQELVDIQGGSMSVDEADQLLNDVNDHGVDPEEAAAASAGLDVDGGDIVES